MTPDTTIRRWAWSGFVLALFTLALGVLAWTWIAMQSSSATFADSEVFADNHLGAGTVDVSIGADTAAFAAVNMAAGDVATGRLEVVNNGTLPFRFVLSAATDGGPLGELLDLVAWTGTPGCGTNPPSAVVLWRPLQVAPTPETIRAPRPASGALAPGESSLLCMRGELPVSAPSSVQGQRLDLHLTVSAEHDVAASEAQAAGTAIAENEGAP